MDINEIINETGLALTDTDRAELERLERQEFGEDYLEDCELDFALDNDLTF